LTPLNDDLPEEYQEESKAAIKETDSDDREEETQSGSDGGVCTPPSLGKLTAKSGRPWKRQVGPYVLRIDTS
jgi:hypothetical protein